MRLKQARVTKYRSIQDSGLFDVEEFKTILVGPNEAGKTVLLHALQQRNPPAGMEGFDPLRDYPRSEYNDISRGVVKPESVSVVEGHFALDDADKEAVPPEFRDATYASGRRLDNSAWQRLDGVPPATTYGSNRKDLARLAAHVDARTPKGIEGQPAPALPSTQLAAITQGWEDALNVTGDPATKLAAWLQGVVALVDEGNGDEEARYETVTDHLNCSAPSQSEMKRSVTRRIARCRSQTTSSPSLLQPS